MIEPVGHRQQPVSAQDISGGLGIQVSRTGPADPRIRIQEVIGLKFYRQPVIKEIVEQVCIPKQHGSAAGKSTGALLPGVVCIRMDLYTGDEEKIEVTPVTLRPVMYRCSSIYRTAGIEIVDEGIQLKGIFVGGIITQAETAGCSITICAVEVRIDIIEAAAIICPHIQAQVDA